VDYGLAGSRLSVHPVRVSVASEQRDLEEKHAARPHGGRSAKPGQNQLCDERLDLKQQECAEQDGGGKQSCRNARFIDKRPRR
jgi:hypothetical protein